MAEPEIQTAPDARPESGLVTLDQWRSLARQEKAAPGAHRVRTGMKTTIRRDAGAEADRTVTFVIGNSTVDRYNDTIATNGYQTEDYLRNPVVLWGHRSWDPPIASCRDLSTEGDNLVAVDQFATKDVYPFADLIYNLLALGFIRMTSVGMIPLEWSYDEVRGGFNFMKQELIEHSVVSIGANRDALKRAASDGVDLEPLDQIAREVLDARDYTIMTRAQAELLVGSLGYSTGLKLFELPQAAFETLVRHAPGFNRAAEIAAHRESSMPLTATTPPSKAITTGLSAQPTVELSKEVRSAPAEVAPPTSVARDDGEMDEEDDPQDNPDDDPEDDPEDQPDGESEKVLVVDEDVLVRVLGSMSQEFANGTRALIEAQTNRVSQPEAQEGHRSL